MADALSIVPLANFCYISQQYWQSTKDFLRFFVSSDNCALGAHPEGPVEGGFQLSTAAEDEEGVDARAMNGPEDGITRFPRARLSGTVFVSDVNGAGEIDGHSSLKKYHEKGKAV